MKLNHRNQTNRRFGRAAWFVSLALVMLMFPACAVRAYASISFIQVAANDPAGTPPPASTTSVEVNYGAAQHSGDLNIVVVSYPLGPTVSSVTDVEGNVYTHALTTTLSGAGSQEIYYAKNIRAAGAGVNWVTVTFSSDAEYPDVRIVEYSGVSTMDAAVGATGTSTTADSGAAVTTTANELLFATDATLTHTSGAGSGYTSRMITSNSDIIEDRTVTAKGTYHGTASISPSGGWIMQLVTFAPANPSPTPLGISGTWHMIFDDEFSGTSLNTTNWNTGWLGCASGNLTSPVNSYELEAYDPAQVSIANGLSLALVSDPATVCGTAFPYRSGMIQSDGKFQYTYGAAEAKIYFPPVSAGSIANWPAFWTDGQVWPTDGEDDIVEGLNSPGQACAHFHDPSGGPGGCSTMDFTGWHTYSSDWENGIVNYYYDGNLVLTINSGITNSPMYLILNYATAGGTTLLVPATMQVQYVRVWQH